MPEGEQIKLGKETYTVVPQGIGRIRRKLVKLMQLGEGQADFDGEVDNQLYDLLKTFIPALPPVYKLLGYESQDQYENDEDPDPAVAEQFEPDLPQLLDAIQTVYTVNGADRLVRLGKSVLGGEGLQLLLRREVLGFFSPDSPSSPSTSDGVGSPSSTTTPPTSTASAA